MNNMNRPSPAPDILYGVPQISAFLKLGQDKTRRLLAEDPTLPCFRLGETGIWMTKTDDLAVWLSKTCPCPEKRRKYNYLIT